MAFDLRTERYSTNEILEHLHREGNLPHGYRMSDLVERSERNRLHYVSPWIDIDEDEEKKDRTCEAMRSKPPGYPVFNGFAVMNSNIAEKIKYELPLEDCTSDSWWSPEVVEICRRVPGCRAAAMAMLTRETKSPMFYRFSGKTPDGMMIDRWTPGMILAAMHTYRFMPFKGVLNTTDGKGGFKLSEVLIDFSIPAFSEKQARFILEKRLYEGSGYTFGKEPVYDRKSLEEMGLRKARIGFLLGGEDGITFSRLPDLDSVQIVSVRPAMYEDLMPCNAYVFGKKDHVTSNVPFRSSAWTTDDLGFLFSILIAPERGLTQVSPYCTGKEAFTFPA